MKILSTLTDPRVIRLLQETKEDILKNVGEQIVLLIIDFRCVEYGQNNTEIFFRIF